jgi:hypothetical protein
MSRIKIRRVVVLSAAAFAFSVAIGAPLAAADKPAPAPTKDDRLHNQIDKKWDSTIGTIISNMG